MDSFVKFGIKFVPKNNWNILLIKANNCSSFNSCLFSTIIFFKLIDKLLWRFNGISLLLKLVNDNPLNNKSI